jgi:hypothetical protein
MAWLRKRYCPKGEEVMATLAWSGSFEYVWREVLRQTSLRMTALAKGQDDGFYLKHQGRRC